MKISFTKMHGIGNDYIYLNCFDSEPEEPAALAVEMSPRHFSVGSDGLVLICRSQIADAKMRMFNADGSEGKMCGNAIRCVGKYIYDNGMTEKTELKIETLSGIKTLSLSVKNGKVCSVCVDMGRYTLAPEALPLLSEKEMIDRPVSVKGKEYRLTAVSVGNPHAVCFLPEIDGLDLEKIGPDFENLSLFPERVNTEFVRRIDPTTLQMRVWERGSGETYACGTGACATVAAAVVNGLCPADEDITVRLIGGELTVRCCSDGSIFMTGAAKKIYEGVYEYGSEAE